MAFQGKQICKAAPQQLHFLVRYLKDPNFQSQFPQFPSMYRHTLISTKQIHWLTMWRTNWNRWWNCHSFPSQKFSTSQFDPSSSCSETWFFPAVCCPVSSKMTVVDFTAGAFSKELPCETPVDGFVKLDGERAPMLHVYLHLYSFLPSQVQPAKRHLKISSM